MKIKPIDMEIAVKIYVRFQQWDMKWYIEHNHTSPSEELRKQKKEEIRKQVLEEYFGSV